MDIQHREFLRPALLYHSVKGLYNHFTEALAGAHDVGGVHRFVCGNQDKTLAAVRHRGIGRLIGANCIILDGLAGAVFHQGDMLMGSGMVYHIRLIIRKHLVNLAAVAHRAN